MSELVLTVDRSLIDTAYGMSDSEIIHADEKSFSEMVYNNRKFLPRNEVETNTLAKQIVSYCAIICDDSIFMTQRTKKQTEARLHNLFSVGIGGHINSGDFTGTDIILHGMIRELNEEVSISGKFTHKFLGIINDNSTEVNSVHTGVCYIINVNDYDCEVKEKEKMTGKWVKLEDTRGYAGHLEGWSSIFLNTYRKLFCNPH